MLGSSRLIKDSDFSLHTDLTDPPGLISIEEEGSQASPGMSINHLKNLNRSLIKSESDLFLRRGSCDDNEDNISIPDYGEPRLQPVSTIQQLSREVKSQIEKDGRCRLRCDPREPDDSKCEVTNEMLMSLPNLSSQEPESWDLRRLPGHDRSSFLKLRTKTEAEKEAEAALVLEDPDMEICDPCYCYTKCWLDTVASLFCVSLL